MIKTNEFFDGTLTMCCNWKLEEFGHGQEPKVFLQTQMLQLMNKSYLVEQYFQQEIDTLALCLHSNKHMIIIKTLLVWYK